MSNTATAAAFLPIAGSLALGADVPALPIVVAVGLAASCAFMLPVATPPNAVVFGSRQVTITQMVRAGLVLNVFGWILITLLVSFLLPLIWGFDPSALPSWLSVGV